MATTNRPKKRKQTQVGLGANEIAFIEDEIAAVAMEYGLEIDDDVAKSIQSRQKSSKHKRISAPATPSASSSLDANALQSLLPKQCSIGPCKSPGCNCRGYLADKKSDDDDCFKCEHGKFLHSIVFAIESEEESKAIHGQVLLGMMYSLVVLGRLASTVVGSNAWTQASLELLQTSVQQHLKRQLLRAQQQQQDTPDVDRPAMTKLSSDLQALIVTATQAVATSGRTQMRIKLACYFDQMYFALYQAAITVFGRNCAAVPPLHEYLGQIDKHRPTSRTDYEMFVATLLDGGDDVPADFHTAYEAKPKHGLALLDVLLCRQREGVQLFYEPSLGMNGEMDKVVADLGRKVKESVKKLTKKQRMNLNKSPADHLTSASVKSAGTALPAYAELRQWRDTCRTWCDKLYSRAIPHPVAFKAIKALGPIVEMGAGLGYWHSLMDQHKIDALAFDPTATAKWSPKTGEDDTADDPDGNEEDVAASTGLPRWSTVYQGNADILDSVPALKSRTLFLCAPPKTSFARDCLRHYKGRHLIHVGEWYGDTGDRQFECDVMKAFALTSRVPLPNWGDTAFELTVWERKTKANQPSLPVVACAVCESRHRSLLRRCSLCKTTVYCSADCMRQHTAVHTAEHARRLVFLNHDDLLDFDNPHHFHPFEWDMHANDDFKAAASWSTTAKEDETFSFKF
ncbi:hypothetical protein DYB31_004501 [Aphanomyces astaci]|uniref:MYND-type domain-containing protein n=1 Tax=Aphanomyces astaci TaxID=112090 RepID=A0A397ECA7_APHAT|nr:hypothetical protein DYB31_004501 [Aphanomyces astaci]